MNHNKNKNAAQQSSSFKVDVYTWMHDFDHLGKIKKEPH